MLTLRVLYVRAPPAPAATSEAYLSLFHRDTSGSGAPVDQTLDLDTLGSAACVAQPLTLMRWGLLPL
jgi:hypothetical protein